jgi:hypothetical protein
LSNRNTVKINGFFTPSSTKYNSNKQQATRNNNSKQQSSSRTQHDEPFLQGQNQVGKSKTTKMPSMSNSQIDSSGASSVPPVNDPMEVDSASNSASASASGTRNQQFLAEGISLADMIDLEVKNHKEMAKLLLELPSTCAAADMASLLDFLGSQRLRTFRQIGEVSDDGLDLMMKQRREGNLVVTDGTFGYFTKLRNVMRDVALPTNELKRDVSGSAETPGVGKRAAVDSKADVDIATVNSQIATVSDKIAAVDDELENSTDIWENFDEAKRKKYGGDENKWVAELNNRLKRLDRKEEQLNEEKKQLNEEKKQLNRKEEQLNRKEEQLNDRLNELIKQQGRTRGKLSNSYFDRSPH